MALLCFLTSDPSILAPKFNLTPGKKRFLLRFLQTSSPLNLSQFNFYSETPSLKISSKYPRCPMGEVIQIHVGQAGVQIANACWELYCLEHGINADGCLADCPVDDAFRTFFSFKDCNKVVPRAVLVDSEPTVVDQIRTGPYGRLYSPGSLITGKEDSGSNFARGYYTMGAELIDITMEAIRLVVESCCNLKGFITFRSIGGGTGSGLGNLIAEQIQQQYEKVPKVEFIVFPSPSMSPLIVEPYNALLASHLGMDAIDCSCIVDNEALYDICAAKLNICAPKYKNLNRIIGQTVSTFTTSQRFTGSSNVSLSEFQTNMVPYPRIHFPVVSYSPFIPGTGLGYTNFTTDQITHACFDPCNQLVRCNPANGKYMACFLFYRGKVTTSDINTSIMQLRCTETVRFVDWSPTGFKVGMNREPPFSVPGGGLGNSSRSVVAFSNNTIIQKAWCRLIGKHERMFSRRTFIHHYVEEGLDEDSLREASEDICALIADYMEVDKAATTDDFAVDINTNGPGDATPKSSAKSACDCCHTCDPCSIVGAQQCCTESPVYEEDRIDRSSCAEYMSIRDIDDDLSMPGLTSTSFYIGDEGCPSAKIKCSACPSYRCATPAEDCCPRTVAERMSLYQMSGAAGSSRAGPGSTAGSIGPRVDGDDLFRLSLPTRDRELNNDARSTTSSRRARSTTNVPGRSSSATAQRRSRSLEPQMAQMPANLIVKRKVKCCKTCEPEAVRAVRRFCQMPQVVTCSPVCRRGRGTGRPCLPGEVLRLPPPRRVGKEHLCEALAAKERFCNSTCKPQACEPRDPICCKALIVKETIIPKICCGCNKVPCCCPKPCGPGPCCRDSKVCGSCGKMPCCCPKPCGPGPCCRDSKVCGTCGKVPCCCSKPCGVAPFCRDPCYDPCRDPLCDPCCSPCCGTCPKPCCDPCCNTCPKPCCDPCCNTCSKPCGDPCCSPCSDPCCDPCSFPPPPPCCDPCCSPCSDPCCDPCCSPKPCREPCCDLCKDPCCSPCCNSCPNPCADPCCGTCSKPCGDPCCDPCCDKCCDPCCDKCCDPCCDPCNKPCCSKGPCCDQPCCDQPCCDQPCCNATVCCETTKCAKMMWVTKGPTCPHEIRPRCFCCDETDEIPYMSSDDKLVPLCCRPPRPGCRRRPNCFCTRDCGGGLFSVSSTVLVPPQCCSPYGCYDDQIVCCPSGDRICECYPECNAMCTPLVCMSSDENLRIKPRLPGAVNRKSRCSK